MITFLAIKTKKYFSFLKPWLKSANIKQPLLTYLEEFYQSLFLTIGLSIFLFFITFFIEKLVPKIMIYAIYFLSAFLPILTIIYYIFYPKIKARNIAMKINSLLPFALSHISSIAESGAPPHLIFKIMSSFKEYEELSNVFKEISDKTEKYGYDLVTAIKSVSQTTPSKSLKKFLNSFVTTIESGGDIKGFLKEYSNQALFEWRVKRQEFIQRLGTFSEIYVGVVVVMPLFVVSLLVVMNFISPQFGALSIMDLMRIIVYLAIPFLNLLFLMFIKGIEVEM